MRSPNPEARLILLSAGCATRRESAREFGVDLARSVDWDLLVAMLRARRLLPKLGRRVLDLSNGSAPSSFASAVEQSVAQTRREAVLLQLVSDRLVQALADAGIPAMPLKGAALADAIYGDPGLRPASDVDLLVAAGDLAAAVAVVREAGYGLPQGHLGPQGLPLLHLALRHDRSELPPIELHWRIHWYERHFARDMLARRVEDGRGGSRPALLDELISLLLFYARDGFQDLRLATDLGAWWDVCGPQLPQGALVEALDRYPEIARALLAAATVAGNLIGISTGWLLDASHGLDARARLAVRLADASPWSSSAQVSAETHLVDWLLTPRGGHREFVRRQLLPPREVLAERSQRRDERPASPIGHGLRLLARFGIALVRIVLRGRVATVREHARKAQGNPLATPGSTSVSRL